MQTSNLNEFIKQLTRFIVDFDNLSFYTPRTVRDTQAQAREVINYLSELEFGIAEQKEVSLCVERLNLTITEADQAFKKLGDPSNVMERKSMDPNVWPNVIGGAVSALQELIRFFDSNDR